MRKIPSWKKLVTVCLAGVVFGMAGGCSKVHTEAPPVTDEELIPVTTMVESYGDIELPIEMQLEVDSSVAMRTDSFQGGIHIYKGRVQIASLRDYIISSMRNHKWKLVGETSFNQKVMLAFTKPNKTCMVVLAEERGVLLGTTQASFYVTVDVAASSRLNPFGEPLQ